MAKFIHVVLRMPSRIAAFLICARQVLAALTGNPSFPGVAALVAVLGDRIQDLEKTITSGTAAERQAAREAVQEVLNHLRDHVESVAETGAGSVDLTAIRAVVESARMDLRKVTPRPKQVFAAVHGPVPGSVDLTAPWSPRRDPHDWAVSTDGETWTPLPSTRQAKTRVTGLPAGVPRYFRHRLLTKDGYAEWSDPVVIVVR
jgi:hypothetical protein